MGRSSNMVRERSDRGRDRRERFVRRTQELPATSQLVYRIDHLSSLPGASVLVAAALLGAVIFGACVSFSTRWETGFAVGTSVVTLIMVFVIQHTQGREQAATQRKLDELLRALPEGEWAHDARRGPGGGAA